MTPTGSIEPTYTLELIPGKDIALFHWVGPITLADRQLNTQRITNFCKKHNVYRILVDGRDQQSETDVVESYDFGKLVPKAFRGFQIAVVLRPDDQMLKLIETVAFNRGGNSRSFSDLRSAQAWLESLG